VRTIFPPRGLKLAKYGLKLFAADGMIFPEREIKSPPRPRPSVPATAVPLPASPPPALLAARASGRWLLHEGRN